MRSTSSFLLAACLMVSGPIFAQTGPDPVAPPPSLSPATIVPAPTVRPLGGSAAQGPSSNKSSRVEGIDYAPDGHPPAASQMTAGTPLPPMPGAHASHPEVERGPSGAGPIAPPPLRGPQPGGPAAPPSSPPPAPDAPTPQP